MAADTALAALKVAAADCFAAQAGFGPDEAAAGLLAADELRALFFPLARGRVTAPSAGVPPPAMVAVAAEPSPLTLLQLPPEVIVLVFSLLDARSLARVAATCSGLYRDQPRPMTPVEEALRQRAANRGHVNPVWLPVGATPWAAHLAWLDRRRDEAWAPVAAYTFSSFFVAEGGRLMSCGTEGDELVRSVIGVDVTAGLLGHGDLGADDHAVPTPTPLPSMAGIRISSVSAGFGFNVAVSAAGKVYTWGIGNGGRLGHGDNEGSLVPKQVQALAGHLILSVATGRHHCLAVTEGGEVFSWGQDDHGQCGNVSSGPDQLLPRRVEALAGTWARNASAGGKHSLVVTEEGALYSFGWCRDGQLGHGCVGEGKFPPKMVDALRHVRIAAAAAGRGLSLALTEDCTVFAWGANGAGQLGLGSRGGPEALPQKVQALSGFKVCAVAAGYCASCAITSAGELFTWGSGDDGLLGHGDETEQLAPKRVEALRDEWVVAVSVGVYHTIVATRNGGVFGWGGVGGLGLPDAPHAAAHQDEDHADGVRYILLPCRYPQLSCVPRS